MLSATTIEKILLQEWDPIGIAHEPKARDEYRTYALHLANLIHHNATASVIAETLLHIEQQQMGLAGHAERARRIADALVKAK